MQDSYTERDLALYALGVGAAHDPMDTKDLPYVYEMSGDGFKTVSYTHLDVYKRQR